MIPAGIGHLRRLRVHVGAARARISTYRTVLDRHPQIRGALAGGDIQSPVKQQRHGDGRAIRSIRWYVPAPSSISGGHSIIASIARWLAADGVRSEVVVSGGTGDVSEDTALRRFRDAAGVEAVVGSTGPHGPIDVSVATYWTTAYEVASDRTAGGRAYLVADWEPWFFPRGAEALLAERTYDLGLRHITLGPWLADRLNSSGRPAAWFPLAHEAADYHRTRNIVRADGPALVAFYARPSTPRRCFDLGVEALSVLSRRLGPHRLEVILFGDALPVGRLPFAGQRVGTQSPPQLRDLYNSADVVLVLSATNPSLIPIEAIACGARVVDLDTAAVRRCLGQLRGLHLAAIDPESIARALEDALSAGRLTAAEVEHAKLPTWQSAARQFRGELERVLDQDIGRHDA